MIRLNLLFALACFAAALAGPDSYRLLAWWGFAAYLVGAVLSVGPWALGMVAKLRVLDRYGKIEPQFARAAEALSVASVFIPFLRAVNAVLAGVALGAWLIGRRRLAQGAVFVVEALIALGVPFLWLLSAQQPLAGTSWLVAAIPILAMAAVYYARNGGFAPQPRTRRPRLRR